MPSLCSAPPDFDNTIVALENAGAELDRVLNVFYPCFQQTALMQ